MISIASFKLFEERVLIHVHLPSDVYSAGASQAIKKCLLM